MIDIEILFYLSSYTLTGKDSKLNNLMEEQIKVLLVDDHQMMRDGLRNTINKQEDMKVSGEASNGKEAIQFVNENPPDAIVMDVDMPDMIGIEATHKIMSIIPEAIVIGLTLHDSPKLRENMLRVGASAYITKNEAVETLCSTIREKAMNVV